MSGLGWQYLTGRDKKAILRGISQGTAFGGPLHVELHPVDRCNLNCFFCGARFHRTADELPFETLEGLIDSMKDMGTRSVSFNGGGEPLLHPRILEIIERLSRSRIPIANITTNGTSLSGDLTEALLQSGCGQVIVSLNTPDEKSYATMMGAKPETFHRVVANIRDFVEARRRRRSAAPRVILHFLAYRANYRTIPDMYRLALSLKVDSILFHGIAFLNPEERMTRAETEEMMAFYERIVREDEYRRIGCIDSLEQDLSAGVAAIDRRIGRERANKSLSRRLGDLCRRRDLSWKEKWRHHWYMRRKKIALDTLRRLDDSCLMPWYALVVRANGTIPVCCVLQGKSLGSLRANSLEEIWHGNAFEDARRQLRRILVEGEAWEHDPGTDTAIESMCAPGRKSFCFMRNFFYCLDVPFLHRLHATVGGIRGAS